MRNRIFGALLVLGIACELHAQVPEYTPEQALSILDRQIRTTLGFGNPGASHHAGTPTWLSLTYVGLEVPKDDPTLVDIIGVQCPPAQNELTTFSTAHRLDQVYELMLTSASLSKPTVSIPGLDAARAKLIDPMTSKMTDKFAAFREFQSRFLTAARLFNEARDRNDPQAVLVGLQTDMNLIEQDWKLFGFKTEIEAALDTVAAADANGSLQNTVWRRELLAFARNIASGLPPTTTSASNTIPRSSLHPCPDKWTGDAGWTVVKFSKENEFSHEEDEYRKTTRYGSAGGGFLFWSASVSGSSTSETEEHREVKKASKLAYEFQVRRAIINRPWLDQRFFFEPGFWTWRRPDMVPQSEPIPLVSKGTNVGFPVENSGAKYIDALIGVPMVPSEVVVARKLSITATVTDSDYQMIKSQSESSANASGRAFFFFRIGGGGTNAAKFTNVTSSAGKTTFTLSFEGPIVIGFISDIVPVLPAPKKDGRVWDGNAWGAQ